MLNKGKEIQRRKLVAAYLSKQLKILDRSTLQAAILAGLTLAETSLILKGRKGYSVYSLARFVTLNGLAFEINKIKI